MQWTSDAPTEAGWYWLKGDVLQLVRVYQPLWETRLWVQYHGTEYEETVDNVRGGEWQGPVVPDLGESS